jgi:hypothetical protein
MPNKPLDAAWWPPVWHALAPKTNLGATCYIKHKNRLAEIVHMRTIDPARYAVALAVTNAYGQVDHWVKAPDETFEDLLSVRVYLMRLAYPHLKDDNPQE